MKHLKRFEELTTTQVIACSVGLPAVTFEELMLAIQKENRPLNKVLIFFEAGRAEADIVAFRALYTEHLHLPERELEIVRNVPPDEIQQMIELGNQINAN